VLFPDRKKYVLGQVDAWFYSSLVFFLLSTIVVHSVRKNNRMNASAKSLSMRLGHTKFDPHNQLLIIKDHSYHLTYKENKILQLFFKNPNQVIERQVFLEEVWEKDGFFVERSMDVFISRIRKYLKADPSLKIENLRSIGYRLHVK